MEEHFTVSHTKHIRTEEICLESIYLVRNMERVYRNVVVPAVCVQ
jgi:hypothetical protein